MKIIVVSHGELAKSLVETSKMLAGDHAFVYALGLESAESTEDFLAKVRALADDGEILFLADLFAGTPFNVCSAVAHGRPNVKVMFGVNLPLLLEAIMSGADKSAEALANHLHACGGATIGIGAL